MLMVATGAQHISLENCYVSAGKRSGLRTTHKGADVFNVHQFIHHLAISGKNSIRVISDDTEVLFCCFTTTT